MFVVIEGANGAGKTSLIKSLERKGYETLSSPNGTDLAKMLRPACRGISPWEDIDKKIQFLLFSAARLDEYIRCVQNNKKIVIADRWWTSTYVYQCILQGIDIKFMENTIHENEKLDLVIVLDGDDEVLLNRVKKERELNPHHGRCRWTQEEKMQKQLMQIYRSELPRYLHDRGIKCVLIDTSNKTSLEVETEVETIIQKVFNHAY